MDLRQRTRRFGRYVILAACILRLLLMGAAEFPGGEREKNTQEKTGQNVRFSLSLAEYARESPAPRTGPTALRAFRGEDAGQVEMDDLAGLSPDLQALVQLPLEWDLADGEPRVLILHTHATESYTQSGEDYPESARYRTLSEEHNMVSIGEAVAQVLEATGIGVIHDRQLHDHPSYNGSYAQSRQSAGRVLEQHPTIRLILDLHRDASAQGSRQLRTQAEVGGQTCAQLMLVVGTDASGQDHPRWQENLALALKLHILLQRQYPGIMRPVNLRSQRFNQDLLPGALLVEVGAAGNTREEALRAARILGEGICALSGGVSPGEGP